MVYLKKIESVKSWPITDRGGPGLEIPVRLKILSITEEKIIHRDISVKQQIKYEITINITCILKKNNNKPIN
jgi:hypothetical protein